MRWPTRFSTFPGGALALVLAVALALAFPAMAHSADELAAPQPAPTKKACHICEDWEIAMETAAARTTAAAAPVATPTLFLSATDLPEIVPAQPVVHGVMFWMEGCGHCELVLTQTLPPLQDHYENQLDIHLIQVVTLEDTDRLYETAGVLGLPKEQVGVPFLILGDDVLVGSQEIPDKLPGLIEHYLAAGGVDYPDLAPLAAVLPTPALNPAACSPATSCTDEVEPAIVTATLDNLAKPPEGQEAAVSPEQDAADLLDDAWPASPTRPNGFELAIAIMAGMVVALVYSGVTLARGAGDVLQERILSRLEWLFPVLALAGLGVAGYLSYVETQAVEAVCGPVGDCNTVQSSRYAQLFGFLPIGVLGAAGYVAILAAWLWRKLGDGGWADLASVAVFVFSLFGVLFSLYLTYLEPFVIRAVCIWCLTSAIIITLLEVLSTNPLLQTLDFSEAEFD